MSRKSIILIVFLFFSLIASLGLVFRTTIFFSKASYVNTSTIALENSYLFASPIQAKADGKEKIRISIFLLDGRGLGVANQTVSLKIPPTLDVSSPNGSTDDTGKITFDISSLTPGKYPVSASTGGKELPQKVNVLFN